jgi:DNA-binding NarL/FixJ family response regulator
MIQTSFTQCLQGLRILVAENQTEIAMEMAETISKAGAMVLGPAATLDETRSLMRRSKPAAAVLDLSLDDGNWASVMIELAEKRVPALFYVKVPRARPQIVFRGHMVFSPSAHHTELLPAITSLIRPRWPASALARHWR